MSGGRKFCRNSVVGFKGKWWSCLRSERVSRGWGKSPVIVASSSHVIFVGFRQKSSAFSEALKNGIFGFFRRVEIFMGKVDLWK